MDKLALGLIVLAMIHVFFLLVAGFAIRLLKEKCLNKLQKLITLLNVNRNLNRGPSDEERSWKSAA